MKKKLLLITLIMVAISLPFSNAFGKNVLRMAWNAQLKCGTNPWLAYSEADYVYLNHIYEPLCVPLMDGSVKPWLAKSWQFDEAAMTWTFHMDKRARWSDGQPLTAQDVKFTLETAWKNDFYIGSSTKPFVDSISVVDDYTFKVKMKNPFAGLLPSLGGVIILPKHIWQGVNNLDKNKNPNPIGSGPFLFKQYKPGAFMVFEKNPGYWRGAPKVDELIIEYTSNTSAAIMALKKGEIDDMPDLTGAENMSPALASDNNIEVKIDQWAHTFYLAPNHRKYPLNNLKFRKALSIAIDRQKIVRVAMGGYAQLPNMGYVPPCLSKYAVDIPWRGLKMKEEARIAEANAILDSLGFKKGKDGIRVDDKGKRLEFMVGTLSEYPAYVRSAQFIKQDLEKIGIKLNVRAMEVKALIFGLVFSENARPNDWDFYLCGSFTKNIYAFAREYASEKPSPWDCGYAFGWKKQDVVDTLRKASAEMNEQKRIALFRKAQEGFYADLVVIPLSHRLHVAAHRTDKFTNWKDEKIAYANMFFPLASSINLYQLQPK